MGDADFATAVDRLINQTAHWEQPRWSAAGRADLVHGLLQELADLGAAAEGRPRRAVPRVGDLVMPDQLRVLADDLLAVPAAPLDEAARLVNVVRARLA